MIQARKNTVYSECHVVKWMVSGEAANLPVCDCDSHRLDISLMLMQTSSHEKIVGLDGEGSTLYGKVFVLHTFIFSDFLVLFPSSVDWTVLVLGIPILDSPNLRSSLRLEAHSSRSPGKLRVSSHTGIYLRERTLNDI